MDNARLIKGMEVFATVAQSGSFSAAANALEMSQPSVSRVITDLESRLGVQLFKRTTRRLAITDAGKAYLLSAGTLLKEFEKVHRDIQSYSQDVSGTLRLGVPHLWAELKISPFLGEFFQRYPGIKLDIVASDERQDIVEDKLDLVLRVGKMRDSTYIAQSLSPVNLIVCASSQYIQRHGEPREPRELLSHQCIQYAGLNRWVFTKKSKSKTEAIDISANVVCKSNLVSIMMSGLLQGVGISLIPNLLVEDYINQGRLQQLFSHYHVELKQLPVEDVFVMYANRTHLPAKTKVLINFLKEKFSPNIEISKDIVRGF